MALIRTVRGFTPILGEGVFLAETAVVIGEVTLGARVSVWYGAVVRGDVHSITIGADTNIQDGAILHCTYQKAPLVIGARVSIGHGAIVHGCTVHDDVLIGMGAKVLDHAVIPPRVIIAAGALVLERAELESGYLYAGVPARRIKPLTAEQHTLLDRLPGNYVMYAGWFEGGPERI
jgi:carbonic anhydrase/acetyltransferase-like protein (isoleucine patch superfamily)